MDDWHYGRLTRASAFQLGDRLIVRVDGVKPTPCHQVELREYVPDREGSADVQLGLYWRHAPGPCERRRTRYVARTEVRVGRMRVDRVRIDHTDGYLDADVEPVAFLAPAPGPDGGALYTGWSHTSFEEAYRKAVALIPRRDAEDLVQARIVDQGGLRGGEAGLDDLFVTVRRVDPFAPG
jgi:hypothetical protein